MNIARFLEEAARQHGDRPAIYLGQHCLLEYHGLADHVARLAGGLAAMGVRAGDRVAIFMENHQKYIEILYAIFHAGGVAVPLNARLHPKELNYILNNSGARWAFCSDHSLSILSEAGFSGEVISVDGQDYQGLMQKPPLALVARSTDDLAWLFYTSGTTGQPKGAMLSHGNLALMAMSYVLEVDDVQPDAQLLHCAPMSHGSGMYNFPHILRGASQIIPESGGFDVDEIARLCTFHREVSFFAAPTMVHRLVQNARADAHFTGLRQITYGGGPMLSAHIEAAIARFGQKFSQIYGQGECPMTISRLPRFAHAPSYQPETYRARIGSVGQAFHLVDVRIDSQQGHVVEGYETGEIMVKSPVVMLGYWQNPDASAAAIDAGWLRTGDIGYMDGKGYLHLVDRAKDVIISGGNNIYSREVEDVLITHPDVLEVAIVGRPDPEWGERVVAFIGHGDRPAPARETLDHLCRAHISRYKCPKEYRYMAHIPKNFYGKIDKKNLV